MTGSRMRSRMDGIPQVSVVWAWKHHFLEICLILGSYLAYVLSRGAIYPDHGSIGLVNAERIVTAERALGVFWEPVWQSWVLAYAQPLATFLNWTYIFTYWPIIIVAGLVLYLGNRAKYYYYRTVVAINLVFALLIFMVFPVTSPFNLTGYFVNTIQQLGPAFYGSPEMGAFYNTHAAMPSLHFSWTVILGALFFRSFKGWFKVAGVAYPVATFLAIIITGNHFILDAVVGGMLAVAAFAVVELGFRGGVSRAKTQAALQWRRAFGPGREYRKVWPGLSQRLIGRARAGGMHYWEAWSKPREALRKKVRANLSQYRGIWLRIQERRPVAFRRRPFTRRRTSAW